ncbi:MAG: hypothetical protein ACK5GU_09815 [Chloroflexota bacterium]|jgi:hypothetical protein
MIAEQLRPSRIQRVAELLSQPHVMGWLMMPTGIWFLAGLYLDGWAHNHGKVDNTFFTPWHAVFYSGFAAVAAVLALFVMAAYVRGQLWQRDLPVAYRSAIVAAPLFAMGGLADLWWHETFGFEAGIEILISPPHLLLASSMFVICAAPARTWAAYRDRNPIPVILSILAAWSVVVFMLQYNHPYGIIWPERSVIGETGVLVGLVSLCLHSLLTTGVVLWMHDRQLPRGSITVVLVINALMIALMGDEYRFGWAALIAGIGVEIVQHITRTQPHARQILALAIVTPILLCSAYFGVIAVTTTLVWPISLCISAIVTAVFCTYSLTFTWPKASTARSA